MKNHTKKGFTLVELLIVVAIIGVLSALAIPMISNVKSRSIASAKANNAKIVSDAVALFAVDNDIDAGGTVALADLSDYINGGTSALAISGQTMNNSFICTVGTPVLAGDLYP